MKTAAIEKEKLENLQRAVRKWREHEGTSHTPRYFTQWLNPSDNQQYWVYNKKYFEVDRKNQTWEGCEDIFAETTPAHLVDFLPAQESKK